MTSSKKNIPLVRLFQYAKEQRREIILASLFSFLKKLFDIAPPLLIGTAVDIVVKREDSLLAYWGFVSPITQFWILAAVTALIWGLESFFQYLHTVYWRNLAQSLQHNLRLDAWQHLQKLDMAFFEGGSSGRTMSILNDDVNQLEHFLNVGANSIIQLATTIILIGGIFFYFSPLVASFSMIPMPIIVWAAFRYQKKIAPRYALVREKVGHLNSRLVNSLGGIVTIKSFTGEKWEVEQLRKDSDAYQEANRQAILLSSLFVPLIRMVIVCGFIATLLIGGHLTLEGKMAVGVYSVLVFLTQRLLWPLTNLGETVDLYGRAMASCERVLDLLDTPVKILSGKKEISIPLGKGSIEFSQVHFSYQEGFPTLKNLNFRVEPGSTIGIIGSTGSGKTSLIKLLLRFYDINSGRILIEETPIGEISLPSLRKNIGLVTQDVFLFHGTVQENIAYGNLKASQEEIEKAAKLAEAHSFIQELPQGYNTIVGERGQKLSGGQRQRISIARAILKNPPILVLDEATSAVDNETEAAIQRSLEKISQNRTTLIIAHRLSTIRHADCILALERGSIVESGTHEQLLRKKGLYHRVWQVQTGERSA